MLPGIFPFSPFNCGVLAIMRGSCCLWALVCCLLVLDFDFVLRLLLFFPGTVALLKLLIETDDRTILC